MTYDPDLLDQRSPTEQSQKLLKNLSESSFKTKTAQIGFLVRQSFDGLNTFARDPAGLKTTTKLFIDVLKEFQIEVITAAFMTWASENSAMPTPADISKICKDAIAAKIEARVREAQQPIKWQQNVYDWNTNEFIESFWDGQHLSPAAMDKRYGSRRICVRMCRQT